MAHLSPAQVAHRVRLRTTKLALARWPHPLERRWRRPCTASHWPQGFVALDLPFAVGCPSPEDNAKGRFEFLGEPRNLGQPLEWRSAVEPQLWRYHLHYWEWAWPLATHPDREWARRAFADLWHSWRAGTVFGRWDEWSPYVASVRAWVLCTLHHPLAVGTDLESVLLDDLGLHGGFIAANLELDVGGNHLIKNVKAAVGLGVLLGDEALLLLGTRHLVEQLGVQVLSDGGHFERSPSYHAQVLGDLIDIERLLAAAGREPVPGLASAITAMQAWLTAMLLPDGDVPVFNDATLVGGDRLTALGVKPGAGRRLTVLQPSGYVIARPDARVHLVADVGPPCPPQLPAHAQADCLTFELAVDGRRLIVDPGTSTYAPGTRRAWERSTSAHNTVAVDGADQTEVWGTFRAARLARPDLEHAADDGAAITVTASHDGYERLPGKPRHRRTFVLTPGRTEIIDEVTGTGSRDLSARLQFAAGTDVDAIDGAVRAGPARIVIDAPPGATLEIIPPGEPGGGVASSFGPPSPASALELRIRATLPVVWSITIEVVEGGP